MPNENIDKQIEEAENKLADLKIQKEELNKPRFKTGDKVVFIKPTDVRPAKFIYTINDIDCNDCVRVKELSGVRYYFDRFRRATPEEITKYQNDLATKKKFNVGDRVVYLGINGELKNGKMYTVTTDDYNGVTIFDGDRNSYYYDKDYFRRATDWEIKNYVEPIFVSGYDAAFDFQYKIVNFGCAAIHFQQIEKAYKFLKEETNVMYGVLSGDSGKKSTMSNRQIVSVRIGVGDFTLEILQKIVDRINENTKADPKNPENIQVGDWVTSVNHNAMADFIYAYRVHSIDPDGNVSIIFGNKKYAHRTYKIESLTKEIGNTRKID